MLERLRNAFAVLFGADSGSWPPGPAGDEPRSRVHVGPHAAMSVPAANACVSILSGTLARLPYQVLRRGEVAEPVEHPAAALLENPSRSIDPLLFWESLGRALHTHGNAFALIRRTRSGLPVELEPADCASIQRRGGRLAYTLSLAGDGFPGRARTVTAGAADVLHLAGSGYDWRTGLAPSPIAFAARNALGMWLAATEHHASTMVRGAHTPLMFETEASVPPERAEEFREKLEKKVSGYQRAGLSPVLPPGVKPNLTGFSSVDLQLIELLKFSIQDIARVWMVPLFLLQHFERSAGGWTNSNLTEQWTNFVRFSLNTHIARYTSEWDAKLLRPAERARLRTHIDTAPLVMGDLRSVADTLEVLVAKAAIWTPEEARAYTGRGPVPQGQSLRQPTGAPRQEAGPGRDASAS